MASQNKTPRIAVAMATYNGGRFIRQQLDSIVAQTLPVSELIIHDDCSTDDTVDICREYAARFPFIKVEVNEKNLGFKRNFESVVTACNPANDYIALADQDDIWSEDHLQTLVDIIADKPLACADARIMDAEGNGISGLTLSRQQAFCRIPKTNRGVARSILLWRNPFQGSSMLMRKDFADRVFPMPERFNYHDAWLALSACFEGGIAYSTHVINNYRMHGGNISGDKTKIMSPLKAYYARVFKGVMADDRLYAVQALAAKYGVTDVETRKFLASMLRYFTLRTPLQKLRNALYFTLNYRNIFTC